MREIKFRAWMKDAKLMIEDVVPIYNEVYGLYCKDFKQDTDKYLKLENAEIMQYTGLKDKNGNEIYGGDIVRHGLFKQDYKMIVRYREESAAFMFGDKRTGFSFSSDQIKYLEVIGNIHENPELLEVQE